jgi:hypothetical protein
MYQSRISAWGLVKNVKKDDMLFVLHKSSQRKRLGRGSSFIVRSRIVTHDDIRKFLQRHEITSPSPNDPPTPPHISYTSPPASPMSRSLSLHRSRNSKSRSPPSEAAESYKAGTVPTNQTAFAQSNANNATHYLPSGYLLSYMTTDDLRSTLSQSVEVIKQPSLPKQLRVSEELLFKIKSYLDGCHLQNISTIDRPQRGGRLWSITILDFRAYGQLACELIQSSSYIEARNMLSRASELVRKILVSLFLYLQQDL